MSDRAIIIGLLLLAAFLLIEDSRLHYRLAKEGG
jgi:hypothetical protein